MKPLLHAEKAVELDPLDLMTNFRLVQANYYARRYDDAVRTGRIAVELTPDSPYTYFYLALSLAALGLKDEAWGMCEQGQKAQRGAAPGRGLLRLCCRSAGTHSRSPQRGPGIGGPSRRRIRPSPAYCMDPSRVGRNSRRFPMARDSLAEHDPFLGSAMVFPAYDAIRDQARFMRLARELKLST